MAIPQYNNSDIYNSIVQNLHAEIIKQYGTVRFFCAENNICRYNLSKVFNLRSQLSLHTFSRICKALKITDFELCGAGNLVLLRDALDINSNALLSALHKTMFL